MNTKKERAVDSSVESEAAESATAGPERVQLVAEVLPNTAETLERMAEVFELSVGELLDRYAKTVGRDFGGHEQESLKESVLIEFSGLLGSEHYRSE